MEAQKLEAPLLKGKKNRKKHDITQILKILFAKELFLVVGTKAITCNTVPAMALMASPDSISHKTRSI